MKVEPMSNAVVTAKALQQFADALPGWVDARQDAALGRLVEQLIPIIDQRTREVVGSTIEQLVPVIDQRAADIAVEIIDQRPVNVDGDAVRAIAADVARQVADDAASRVLAQVDTDQPAIDVDRLKFDVIEAALRTITDYLPALVAAAAADSVHEVVRDGDGRIKRVETKAR